MLQLDNRTPFSASMATFPDESGIDTLYVNVKARFQFKTNWVLCDEQLPPQQFDEYLAEPGQSSITLASDFHTGKAATDIIMLGAACAKDGKAVRGLDVTLEVGKRRKAVRVFGDRQWHQGEITPPQAFHSMPLVYERAYGGQHVEEGRVISAEVRNPVGLGYLGERKESVLDGTALPNLEDPQQLIRSPKDTPAPTCFAFVAPNWHPRTNYAGTYDDTWRLQRAPFLPEDFNKRFLNCAHQDLIYPGFIQGGESVSISNMHPQGEIHCQLPTVSLACRVDVNNEAKQIAFNMETLTIEPNQKLFSMSWKAAYRCDKQLTKIKQATVFLNR